MQRSITAVLAWRTLHVPARAETASESIECAYTEARCGCFATSMHSKDDHIEARKDNYIEVQGRCNGNCIELLATIHRYGADNVLPTEFVSASDTTEDNFTL